jgi:predicted nucleic acid-binding protein
VTTVLDTGPLVAAADRADKYHQVCADLLAGLIERHERLIVPIPVIVEACWPLEKYQGPGAEARFLDLVNSDPFELAQLVPS